MPRKVAVTVENHGSICLFRCHNEDAVRWLLDRTDGNWFGAYALAVEPRYANDLANGLLNAGFDVKVAA